MPAIKTVVLQPERERRRRPRFGMVALVYILIAWAFHAGTINPTTNLAGGGDAFVQGIPSKIFATSFNPWNPYVQSGKYVSADVLYQSFYPPSLLILTIFPNTLGFNLFLISHYALAGIFMYLFLASLRLTPYAAFVGGLIFMVCGFLTAHKCHEYIICAAVWLPLALYFIHRYAGRLRIVDLGYAALCVSLSALAGFPQITFYSILLIVAYIAFSLSGSPLLRDVKSRSAQIAIGSVTVLGIGLLAGCLPLFAVAEALPHLTRERLNFATFSSDNFPPWELFTFLIPNLFGGANRHIPMYAPNTTIFIAEVYPYLGLLPLVFAGIIMTAWRTIDREPKFWVAVASVALLLSFGAVTPLYQVLFYVPVYNLFRVPGRHLFEVDLAITVIAAFGLDYLIRRSLSARAHVDWLIRRTLTGFCLLFGSALLIAITLRCIATGMLARLVNIPDSATLNYGCSFGMAKRMILKNLSWNSPSLIIPLLFFALTFTILVLLPRTRMRKMILVGIPIVILADAFLASYRMYDHPSTVRMYAGADRPELAFLNAQKFDPNHYRLFPVDFDPGSLSQLTTTYHLSTVYPYPLLNILDRLPVINDYGPFWLKRYQVVTGFDAGGRMPAANLKNYKILSLLGVRYLLALSAESKERIEQVKLESAEKEGNAAAYSALTTTSNGITIYKNRYALPRFRFVSHLIPARDASDAVFLMNRPGFDPSEEAIVEEIKDAELVSPGKILEERSGSDKLEWKIETSGRSFFVVEDSFFPGWTAMVDNEPATLYPVYGCLRGIRIDTPGQHHIEMRFVPRTLNAGLAGTIFGVLIVGGLHIGGRKPRPRRGA